MRGIFSDNSSYRSCSAGDWAKRRYRAGIAIRRPAELRAHVRGNRSFTIAHDCASKDHRNEL
jgi:hypothetical protein